MTQPAKARESKVTRPSRGRETRVILISIMVIALAGGLGWWYWRGHPDPAMPESVQEVMVRAVPDGDTLEVVALDPGRVVPSTTSVQVRLLGVDAPEMHDGGPGGAPQCWAENAKAKLTDLAPPGSHLWLTDDTEPRDSNGRYLVYAWTGDGLFVNHRLAEIGSVRPVFVKPNLRYHKEITKTADEARKSRRGLWGACEN